LLAIFLCILVIIHLSLLHEVGSSNPFGLKLSKDALNFYKSYGLKDKFIFFSVLAAFVIVVFFYPNLLGHPDNYIKADSTVTPTHIVPEWYFLPFYAILRSVDNKILGVLAMLFSILILLVLPLSKRFVKNSLFIGSFDIEKNIFFYMFSICIVTL